jgi:G6PDH family F420-dependent oxidoreductase
MTRFGYTLMTEQSGPKELVRYAVSAEHVGFDFEVSSDHYFPWLASQGEYFEVDSARIWDVPDTPVAIAAAVSGERSVDTFAPLADQLVAVEPNKGLVNAWHEARRATGIPGEVRVIGQIPTCWDPDRDTAVRRAHDQFRWFGGGWAVNADLPTTAAFDGATQFVRPGDVAESIPCGPDLDAIVDAVREYWEAGFTDIALVQIGDEGQDLFLKEAAGPLLDKLRSASK